MYLASRSPRPELISPSRERAGGTRPRAPFPVISHLHTRPSRPDPGGNRVESCPHQRERRERRGRFTNRPDPPPSSSPGTCTCCIDLGRDSTEPEQGGRSSRQAGQRADLGHTVEHTSGPTRPMAKRGPPPSRRGRGRMDAAGRWRAVRSASVLDAHHSPLTRAPHLHLLCKCLGFRASVTPCFSGNAIYWRPPPCRACAGQEPGAYDAGLANGGGHTAVRKFQSSRPKSTAQLDLLRVGLSILDVAPPIHDPPPPFLSPSSTVEGYAMFSATRTRNPPGRSPRFHTACIHQVK